MFLQVKTSSDPDSDPDFIGFFSESDETDRIQSKISRIQFDFIAEFESLDSPLLLVQFCRY